MAELTARGIRVVLRRLFPMDTAAVLTALFTVAEATVDRGRLFRMWDLFDIAVARDALDSGMGRRFQCCRVETRGYTGLPLPDTRAGIVAAGAVLGMQLRRLLARDAGGQEGRNGSEPE